MPVLYEKNEKNQKICLHRQAAVAIKHDRGDLCQVAVNKVRIGGTGFQPVQSPDAVY